MEGECVCVCMCSIEGEMGKKGDLLSSLASLLLSDYLMNAY
jgi:hypothetical protein